MSDRASSPTRPVRIVTAHANAAARQALRALIGAIPEWDLCGEVTTGEDAVETARRIRPDVMVVDLAVPGLNGLAVTRRIREALPDTEILVLTAHEAEDLTPDILAAGARGYLLSSDLASGLVAAIEALARHRPYLTWNATRIVLEAFLKDAEMLKRQSRPLRPLTPREREIMQLLAEGLRNDEISALLVISVKTVETHRAAIMRKLGLSSLAELIRYAIRNRVIDDA